MGLSSSPSTPQRFGLALDRVVAIGWILLGVGVMAASQPMREPAGRFPTLAGALLVVLAALHLAQSTRGAGARIPPPARSDAVRTAELFASLLALFGLAWTLGLVIGGFAWAMGVFVVLYRWSPVRSLAYACLFIGAIAVVFPALGLQLPAGALFAR